MQKPNKILHEFLSITWAVNSPDCWTREAGLDMACSGPFRTLLAAPEVGPGGRPRDAEPRGAPPILSSLSSPVLLSRSPSSDVRLAPWQIIAGTLKLLTPMYYNTCITHGNVTHQWWIFKAPIEARKLFTWIHLQISTCSNQRHSHRRNPDDGKDSWRAGVDKSNLACHRNVTNGKNSDMWRTRL